MVLKWKALLTIYWKLMRAGAARLWFHGQNVSGADSNCLICTATTFCTTCDIPWRGGAFAQHQTVGNFGMRG